MDWETMVAIWEVIFVFVFLFNAALVVLDSVRNVMHPSSSAAKSPVWTVVCDHTFNRISKCPIPLSFQSYIFKIVGLYNGLLCLAKHGCSPRFAEVLYLWNPSIRKFKRFPNSCLSQYIWMATGFAYQSQSHDCKVVEIFCLCPYKEIEPEVAAEVYTLCWD